MNFEAMNEVREIGLDVGPVKAPSEHILKWGSMLYLLLVEMFVAREGSIERDNFQDVNGHHEHELVFDRRMSAPALQMLTNSSHSN